MLTFFAFALALAVVIKPLLVMSKDTATVRDAADAADAAASYTVYC